MQIDLFGKKRWKVNLHMHTTVSDGKITPEEAIARYRQEGYDALAIADHWAVGEERWEEGLLVLSAAEYHTPFRNAATGMSVRDACKQIFHIVAVGLESAPAFDVEATAQEIIDGIHEAGGLAVLAHPAWSLNDPSMILPLRGVDATEIYNTYSGCHNSRRPDSSLIVDMLASYGRVYPLLAVDDSHWYDGEECKSWIMAEAEELSREALLQAVREGRFYATQGPEVHLAREGEELVVRCSPCSEVVFFSNTVWAPRAFCGDGLTEIRYKPGDEERFVRAAVRDAEGRYGWTNFLPI